MQTIETVVVSLVVGGTFVSLCVGLDGLSFRRQRLPNNPLRSKDPATPEDLQKERIATVVGDLAILLGAVLIAPSLFPQGVTPAISKEPEYQVVSGIGFLAVVAALVAGILIRRDVHYTDRPKTNRSETPGPL